MDLLPSELQYRIGLPLNYIDLEHLSQISRIYEKLFLSSHFWEDKAHYDFDVSSDEFRKISRETKSAKETYIRISGEHDVPIPGNEKYGNVDKLAVSAARGNNFPAIQYFYRLSGASKVLYLLAKRNKGNWIEQLAPEKTDINIKEIGYGALVGGHWDLISQYVPESVEILGRGLECAVVSGKLLIVKFVNNLLLERSIDNEYYQYELNQALGKAAGHNYYDIFEFLTDCGARNFSLALQAAAAKGHRAMIDHIIAHKDRRDRLNLNLGLCGAAQGGFRDIVDFMILLGANRLDLAIMDAAKGGFLDIIKYLLSIGGRLGTQVLNSAVLGNHLEVIRYLLAQNIDISNFSIRVTVAKDNPEIFSLLIDKRPVQPYDDLLKFAILKGSYKILILILKMFTPTISPDLFSEIGKHLNIHRILKEYVNRGVQIS